MGRAINRLFFYRTVAPFTGAWIEIEVVTEGGNIGKVAPFTGAWIEIIWVLFGYLVRVSLPSRERGLKCFGDASCTYRYGSLPSRERGLK